MLSDESGPLRCLEGEEDVSLFVAAVETRASDQPPAAALRADKISSEV